MRRETRQRFTSADAAGQTYRPILRLELDDHPDVEVIARALECYASRQHVVYLDGMRQP